MNRINLVDRMAFTVSHEAANLESQRLDVYRAAGYKVQQTYPEPNDDVVKFRIHYYIDFETDAEAALFKLTHL